MKVSQTTRWNVPIEGEKLLTKLPRAGFQLALVTRLTKLQITIWE